jgi:hypothetical protein
MNGDHKNFLTYSLKHFRFFENKEKTHLREFDGGVEGI